MGLIPCEFVSVTPDLSCQSVKITLMPSSPTFYASLDAIGRHGQPVAAISLCLVNHKAALFSGADLAELGPIKFHPSAIY